MIVVDRKFGRRAAPIVLLAAGLGLGWQSLPGRTPTINGPDPIAVLEPVEIGQLSRMVPAGEARATRAGIADGTVDIVIGTHALLAKSIRFADLGLLIVDEEQHFGVRHKERLKELRADVHVLTLTATPIPRCTAAWFQGSPTQ